jgi:hypothetical protein
MANFKYSEQKYGKAVVSDIESGKPIKLFGASRSIVVDNKDSDYLKWKSYIDKNNQRGAETFMKGKEIFVDKKSKASYAFTKIDKAPYSGSGGSGGGATQTAMQESAVCIVTAMLVHKGEVDLTQKGVDGVNQVLDLGKGNSKSEIKKILDWLKSDPDWLETSIKTAKEIINQIKLTKSHNFHRDSAFMNSIYKQFQDNLKPLNKLGLRISGDKWNPADIWITDKNVFPSHTDLSSLNDTILKKFEKDETIGISLKKVGSSVTWSVYNLPKSKQTFKFEKIIPPKSPMSSKDAYIETKSGLTIQIRSFNDEDNIQCELKGKHAAGGKCGFGATRQIVESISNEKILLNSEIKEMGEPEKCKLISEFYKMTGTVVSSKKIEDEMANKEFKDKKKRSDFFISKIQALQIASIIATHKKKNDIITGIFGYAHSLGLDGLFEASVYAKIY